MAKYFKCTSKHCGLKDVKHDHLVWEFSFAVPEEFRLSFEQKEQMKQKMAKAAVEYLNFFIQHLISDERMKH